MAGRATTKKTASAKTADTAATTATTDDTFDRDAEIQKLAKENSDLKKAMQSILSKLEKMDCENEANVKRGVLKKESVDNSESQEHTYVEIDPLKPIKLISLTSGGLTLRTDAKGRGRNVRFTKFGQSRFVPYQDLQNIMTVDRTFIEQGYVYICDKNVVHNNYLDDDYQKFLSQEKIENILSFPTEEITKMIQNTTAAIQDTIIDLIVRKINNSEYVDMNKVTAIGNACETPCDIMQIAMSRK
ncbi:MAG: hypothetical protein ACLTBR_03470 [Anaerostipes sp.]|uniref:hypothetical protein n=1 Tax=Anaerostipes sp. TaxID=1872530 RepID=UPI00399234AB